MSYEEIVKWLSDGDVAIQYQAYRDLLGEERVDLQNRIATEGWGAEFISRQNPNGHWGRKYYQPKWTSTHYTLLDIKNLGMPENCEPITKTAHLVLETEKGPDGGVMPTTKQQLSDVCINGMFLNVASYFHASESQLISIVNFILSQHMPDGGFNCRSNRSGATHSSLHTTISVLEGIAEYQNAGYTYRISELQRARTDSEEFLLQHYLYKSHRTGEVIRKEFLHFHYPARWHYDILRAMDYFALTDHPYDSRMKEALDIILASRTDDGRWTLPAKYPGHTHFDMEKAGQPSRWNTLRALRVVKSYAPNCISD